MFVYLIMLAASAVLGILLCDRRYGKVGKAIYCVVGAVAFIVISSMRYEVGRDFNSYGQMYVNYAFVDVSDIFFVRTEKGFAFPLYVLSLVFENFYAIYIYTSIIIYAAVFWLIYKYSSLPWISVSAFLCLGVYFNSLCFLRQFIAGITVTYALKFISEKKSLYFFVLVLAAATFHWSALIMIAIYFLIRIKPGYIYLGIATAGTILACIFSHSIMNWAIKNIYVYRNYDITRNVEASTGLHPRYTVMFGIVFVIAFLFRKRLMEKNPDNSLYINLLMYTVIFEAVGMRHAILSRFAIVTYLAPILYLIPDLVQVCRDFIDEHSKDSNRRFLANVCTASAASVFGIGVYLLLMSVNYNGVVPYKTFNARIHVSAPEFVEEDEDFDEEDYDEDEDTEITDEPEEIAENDEENDSENDEIEEEIDPDQLEQDMLDALDIFG